MSTGNQPQFLTRKNKAIEREDLPNLPDYLVEYFELFDALLSQDPYCPENLLDDDFETDTGIRFYSHDLDPSRELSGCWALDIIYLQEHYRIVYRVDNRPKFRRVDIISFDRHNPAYDKAANRTFRSR